MTDVLVLSDLWPPFPGGAERLAFNLARHLHRSMSVHVLTGYEHAQPFDGPPVTIEPIGIGDAHAQGAAIIAGYLEQHQPRVIVTHHLYAFEFEHELPGPVVQIVLNNRRLPHAALAVYISQWVKAQCRPEPHDLVLTPPAFDDCIADHHGERIGFIKPIRHKGIDLLYAIAGAMPDRDFLVLRGEWQTLEDIRHLPNVKFMEPVEDIRTFYAECRLVLMPSTSEDAGTVAQEATLNRLPCISSNVQGLAETNRGGILLPPKNLDAWLVAIKALDDNDTYSRVVERQAEALAATDQDARLDELTERIDELVHQ